MKKIELRFTPVTQAAVLCRAAENEDESKRINGYAAVFYDGTPATEYRLWPNCFERIDPAAFDEVLKDNDTRGLFNHNSSAVLGRTTSATLRLSKDSKGLAYEIDMPDTSVGNDTFVSIERGDVTGSSFAFVPDKVEWSTEMRGDVEIEVRTIKSVGILYDVGPVTFPAYEATTSSARDRESIEAERAELLKEKNDDSLILARARADADLVLTNHHLYKEINI